MKASKFFKHLGKFIGFGMLTGIFVLVFGLYWELSQGNTADYDAVKEAINQYGEDLNEMREYLYLPAHNYDFFQASITDSDSQKPPQQDTQLQKGMLMFAEDLAKKEALIESQEWVQGVLEDLINDPEFLKGLREINLSMSKEVEMDEDYGRVKILSGKEPLVQLILSIENKQFSILSVLGKETVPGKEGATVHILDFLKANKDQILETKEMLTDKKSSISALWQDEAIADVLKKNSLTISPEPVETTAGFEYYVTDLNGSPLLTIALDRETGRFVMQAVGYASAEALKSTLLEKLQKLNGETEQIKAIKTKQANLEDYLKSAEFQVSLKTAEITISEKRSEGEKDFYDLMKPEDEKLGSIVFDKQNGQTTFIDAADGLESSLEDILSGSKKKP